MFWLWSAGIWITEFQSWPYILRGSQNIIYMLTNILYVIGAVYLFDENATTYTLISMALANFAVFMQVGLRFGFPRLISEYITLLLTFADNTGGAVRQMELHDMVYGWGTYVVYYMISTWLSAAMLISAYLCCKGIPVRTAQSSSDQRFGPCLCSRTVTLGRNPGCSTVVHAAPRQ